MSQQEAEEAGEDDGMRFRRRNKFSSLKVLGTVGETGSLEGPGLYFEVRRGGVPLDPAEWLAKG